MPSTTWTPGPATSQWQAVYAGNAWLCETASDGWNSEPAFLDWSCTLSKGWDIVGFESIIMSHLSTEYVNVPVSVTKAGQSYNPTSDTVQFAFMPTPTQVPQVSDWVSGIWETDSTNILYPYLAQCLVGPAGTITLGTGNYIVYIKITDNPEVPVLVGGQLAIN